MWNHPILKEPILFTKSLVSTSLKPATPSVSYAWMDGDMCKMHVKFPNNVAVKDTYEHFVSFIQSKFLFFKFKSFSFL